MGKIDVMYHSLVDDILTNGKTKKDRTGTGTISIFERTGRIDVSKNFPLISTKKMFTKGVIYELLWFLKCDTNIKFLVENGVNIWNGDAHKAYKNKYMFSSNPVSYKNNDPNQGFCEMNEFVEKIKTDKWFSSIYGELGPIYGKQWVDWVQYKKNETTSINQINNLVNDLKNNPDSRRLVVSAWNVGELDKVVLPPCHMSFQCYTHEILLEDRIKFAINNNLSIPSGYSNWTHELLDIFNIPKRKIDLSFRMRSVDVCLGLPFNISSYAFLLYMLAQQTNMIPNELIYTLGDTHIYLNHIEGAKKQLSRDSNKFDSPTLELNKVSDMFSYKYEDFKLEGYQSYPTIKMELSN